MKRMIKLPQSLLMALFVLLTFTGTASASEPLNSWVDGPDSIKQKIIAFVEQVSDKNGPNFVPVSERIATFDMDGTLVCEKPKSMGGVLSVNFLKAIANESKTLSQVQPYKAALENDQKFLSSNFIQVLITAYMGYSQSEYRQQARRFINTEKHPRFGVAYGDLIYQPMLELVEYLKSKQFDVYIVSGSWQGFVRVMGKEKLGFEYSHLIGSKIGLDFQYNNGKAAFLRAGNQLEPANVHDGKPENIQAHIGIKPILAFGNSSGDQEMYEYVGTNEKQHLVLSLEHDDPEREYKYNSKVEFEANWLKVSMKNNFKIVFKE